MFHSMGNLSSNCYSALGFVSWDAGNRRVLGGLVLIALLFGGSFGCSSSSSRKGGSQGMDIPQISDEDLKLEQQNRWGSDSGSIPKAMGEGVFRDVLFDYDDASVRVDQRDSVRKSAEILKADPSLRVELEGHCDNRGTNEYNLALGEERARSVATFLASSGVSASQISTISYGEEIPLDSREAEDAFAKNRRVHFAVFRKNEKQN